MPHFVIEYGGALNGPGEVETAMETVLECGAASGIIRREDMKVRAVPYESFLFGDGRTGFVHLTISLLAGRTDEQKEALAIALRDALGGEFPDVPSISIDIRDMNPVCYKKRLV